MKLKIRLASLLLTVIALNSRADSFESRDARTQAYLIPVMAEAVGNSEIIVMHRRRDDQFRKVEPMPPGYKHLMGLTLFRTLAVLKGSPPHEPYSVAYFYPPPVRVPYIQESLVVWLPVPYRPSVLEDDLVRLMFVRPQKFPLPDRTPDTARREEDQGFVDDCRSLPGGEFLQKYGIQDVFASQVFVVVTTCVFRVEYPVPELPPVDMGLNRENFIRSEGRIRDLQNISGLITLTPREVSEIVFTAYWLEGADEGAAKYATACAANPGILLPVASSADFETEIGKRLFEAVKAKPPVQENPPAKASP